MTDLRYWINLGSIPFWFVLQIDEELLVRDLRLLQSKLSLKVVQISEAVISLDLHYVMKLGDRRSPYGRMDRSSQSIM